MSEIIIGKSQINKIQDNELNNQRALENNENNESNKLGSQENLITNENEDKNGKEAEYAKIIQQDIKKVNYFTIYIILLLKNLKDLNNNSFDSLGCHYD